MAAPARARWAHGQGRMDGESGSRSRGDIGVIRHQGDHPIRAGRAVSAARFHGRRPSGAHIWFGSAVTGRGITASAGGQGESCLPWAVFAALIIAGTLTALQASRIWRLGAGHVLIMGATPNFVAVSVLALN